MHESSEAIKQPKDFTKINKSLLQKSIKEEKLPEKELRKKLGNIRKKVKKGHKPEKILSKCMACLPRNMKALRI